MLKKILSLSLALCMILSLAAIVPVWADVTYYSYSDNFEEVTRGTISTGTSTKGRTDYKYYTSAKVDDKNGAFRQPDTSSYDLSGENTMSFAYGRGVGGSTALKMTAGTGDKTSLLANPVQLPYASLGDQYMLASYKVKILSQPTEFDGIASETSWLNFGGIKTDASTHHPSYFALHSTAKGKINWRFSASISSIAISENQWYTIVFSAYRSATDTVKVSVSLIDENGNIVYDDFKDISRNYMKTTYNNVYFYPVLLDGTKITSGKAEILIDDFELHSYEKTLAPSVVETKSSITDGADNVAVGSAFTVGFDQYVTGTEEVKIYKSDDVEKNSPITATVSKVALDRFTIKPDEPLDPETDYYIDLSTIKNKSNSVTATTNKIAFTTAAEEAPAGATTITVGEAEYTITERVDGLVAIPGCKPEGTVTSLSMEIENTPVTVAKSAWQVDGTSGELKILNSLITNGAVFKTDTTALEDEEVTVITKMVGVNDAKTSLYMLGKVEGPATEYGARLSCVTDSLGISGDYAADANGDGEFLVELGYASKLPADTYSLTAYADGATGKTGTVTITE